MSGMSRNAVTVSSVTYPGSGLARYWTFNTPFTHYGGGNVTQLQILSQTLGWVNPTATNYWAPTTLRCFYPVTTGAAYYWRILTPPSEVTWLPRYLTTPIAGVIF
jgi:hypothetical protein